MKNNTIQKTIPITEVLKFCFKLGAKYPLLIFLYILPGFLVPLDHVLQPYILKKIIDTVTVFQGNEMLQKVLPFVIGYILCAIFWELAWRLYSYFVNVKYVPQLRSSIVLDSMEKFFKKSHRFYQNEMSGKLTKRVMDLSDMPIEILFLLLNRGTLRSFSLVGSIVMLFICQKTFGCIILCWCFLLGIVIYYLLPRIIKRAEEFSEQGSVINGQVTDVFTNISSVRLFSNWKLESLILGRSTRIAMLKEVRMEKLYLILFIGASVSFVLLQTLSLYFLIKLKMVGAITAGDFALVMTINFNIIQNIWELTFELMGFTKCIGKTQQALKSLYSDVEIENSAKYKNISVREGEIIFDSVSFKYPEADEKTFENFYVKINPAEKVGLVGESGAGKTTFVNLLLGLYDIQKGKITIDGENIGEVSQDSLHRNIAVIPQDPSLFHRTLFDNILYGDSSKSQEEVYNAAKNASIHDFILSTPYGYSSLAGERGLKISGGQRQRIAIARAFLKNSPILILDEATSALDSITEKEIQNTLWHLMQNKTCIVVAHRLSTLVDMDRILVFDSGKIVQDGSHAKLITQDGIYKNLWDTQVNGFIVVN